MRQCTSARGGAVSPGGGCLGLRHCQRNSDFAPENPPLKVVGHGVAWGQGQGGLCATGSCNAPASGLVHISTGHQAPRGALHTQPRDPSAAAETQ